MNRIGIMQLTDTLAAGGLERVAVNVANHLPIEHYRSHLCVTRAGGALEQAIDPAVSTLYLRRKGRFDVGALRTLIDYIREHRIQLLHAHGTAVFVAAAVSLRNQNIKLIWHDHFGRFGTEQRSRVIYGLMARRVNGVISVTERLAAWARQCLRVSCVSYIPNFASPSDGQGVSPIQLPGTKECRVVCVANLRPQKNHLLLFEAFRNVVDDMSSAQLILIGSGDDACYVEQLRRRVAELQLQRNVTWLGCRTDVQAVLKCCEIGVLSSDSEGLPIALLEYGAAGLAGIATDVGQCGEVLERGGAGLLVPSGSRDRLANAIRFLLRMPRARQDLAAALSHRIRNHYSPTHGMQKIVNFYAVVLGQRPAVYEHSFC